MRPRGDITPHLELAFYIGQSHVVGGTTTDTVAYASHASSYRPGSGPTTVD